jgi:integrase
MKRKKRELTSGFADRLRAYVDFRRGLGRAFRLEESILRSFDRYAAEKVHSGSLSRELVIGFVFSTPGLSSVQYAKRYRLLVGFSEYLRIFEPDSAVLDPKAVRAKAERHPAHIYAAEEIAGLLHEAKQLRPADSLRPLTYYTLFGLLASSGLRVGETIKLDRTDVDLKEGVLSIRESKFRKSRLVPVHSTTLEALRQYAEARNRLFPKPDAPAFFLSERRKRLNYTTVVATFLTLARRAGIRAEQGRGPRLHDLRHSFAVKRVLAWYDAGEDVQARLPELATYMGHAHFEDTTYYLTAGAELMDKASRRFDRFGGSE